MRRYIIKKFYKLIESKGILIFFSGLYCLLNGAYKKISGKNNEIKYQGVFIKHVRIEITGDNNKIFIDKGTIIENSLIRIIGNDHLLIIDKNCRIRDSEFWFEGDFCKISLDSKVRVNGVHVAVTETKGNIQIGYDCLFSKGIDIRNGDSHSIIDLATGERINYPSDVIIGSHVWVAKDVKILKGSIIGDGCVIGTGSVVNG